jgi:Leucine-rich repeat (LRR) protein
LEGCPNGLKKLYIRPAPNLTDLSPLASCSMMESLMIWNSSIIDISVVASMPLLEVFICRKRYPDRPSIKDPSPLASCPELKTLYLCGNREIKDIPVSVCTALECLHITGCSLITSLAPLLHLQHLETLKCEGIHPQTSLLPLISCTGLKELWCSPNAVDLDELRRRRLS